MSEQTGKRRMAAVLAADVAGYSRLMGADEEATIAALGRARAVFREHVAAHDGRVVDTAGDSVLSIFESIIEAVRCALAVQETLAARNADVPEDRRMRFRIGVHFGDIVEHEDGTIYGDGVNIAARLESLAEPGGLTVSGTVHEHIEGKLGLGLADLGEQQVKNIAKPVRAWRVAAGGAMPARRVRRRRKFLRAAAAVAAALTIAAVLWLGFDRGPLSAPTPDAEARAIPTGPSIAVLPFTDLSGAPGQAFFADGLTEDIIAAFTRFRNFLVIAGNSTFAYKGRTVDVREIGIELGVNYVLEGSVRRTGERIRVIVELLDTRSGGHLWAETYERDATTADIFAIQDEITEAVVGLLADAHGVISRQSALDRERQSPENVTSYDCILKFYGYIRDSTASNHAAARTCLEETVQREPSYAFAWAGLAEIYMDEQILGFSTRPDLVARAVEAARQAVALDPRDARAHILLAWASSFMLDWETTRLHANEAIRLNALDTSVLVYAALIYSHLGEWELGFDLATKSNRLNPSHPGWHNWSIVHYHFANRDYGNALRFARLLGDEEWFWVHATVAAILGHMGRQEEAREALDRALALKPDLAETFWDEIRFFFSVEATDAMVQDFRLGLHKAGLAIPPEPKPTD